MALEYFRPGARTSARVETKGGGSPVTAADLAANSLLKRRLRDAVPDAGWLSEETATISSASPAADSSSSIRSTALAHS